MSTFSGIWIHAPDGPTSLKSRIQKRARQNRLLRGIWELRFNRGCEWVLAEYGDEDALSDLARELSAGTTAIGVAFQSVVDAFVFSLYRNGVECRSLRYGVAGPEERMWEVPRGQPEPWEESVLWADAEEEIQTLSEFIKAEEITKYRAAFAAREIQVESHFPSIDARSCTWSILKSYGVHSEWPERLRVGPPWPLRLLPLLW